MARADVVATTFGPMAFITLDVLHLHLVIRSTLVCSVSVKLHKMRNVCSAGGDGSYGFFSFSSDDVFSENRNRNSIYKNMMENKYFRWAYGNSTDLATSNDIAAFSFVIF